MQKCHPSPMRNAILSSSDQSNPSKLPQKPDFGRMVCRLTDTLRNAKLQNLKNRISYDTRKSK
jgi:hypothetical protein